MSKYTTPAIKTFATREQAQAEAKTMRGWTTSIVENQALDFLPIDEENRASFSIRCDGSKFLYDDGYVR